MGVRSRIACLGAAAAIAAAPAPASAAAPLVEQMVVFRDGTTVTDELRARATRVRVGRRRCKVGKATPLAALVRSRVARLRLRDFGRCGRRARDAGQLYVAAIGRDRERGRGGWVYKVGRRQGTAGAADPAGPFGRGRLRRGARITWFYCILRRDGSCQRTLGTRSRIAPDGSLTVRVRSYDDEGRARRAGGVTVHAGEQTAVAGADGVARFTLPPGRHTVFAEGRRVIRSFPEEIEVP